MPFFVGTLAEGATALLVALVLAFLSYIRNPANSLLPSSIFSAVLAFHSYWMATR